jgi:hypothetical protein
MRTGSENPILPAIFAIPESRRARLAAFGAVLRTVAGPMPTDPPPPEGFSDEMGHRRPVDRPFLAWRSRTPHPHPPGPPDAPLDVALWSAVAGHPVDVDAVLARHRPPPGAFGALLDQTAVRTIEVWTETELSALHALSWLALRDGSDTIARTVLAAARWHVDHMQPDNATNHPWCAHVFALLDALDDRREAGLYAQTLVHNCQTALGRPDRLSTQILLDAADALEALLIV